MRQNFYKEFAFIYDKLMIDVDYEKWTNFILKNIPPNSKKLLEAACGTGGITYNLAQGNLNITAFDISEEMLIKAYEKLRRYKNVNILNQDMTKFKINKQFDASICCCDGVNYLDESSSILFFQRVFNRLNQNGKFIFDISTEYKYNSMDETYIYDEQDLFYVWENNLDKDKNTVSMEINFFIKEQDKYSRITEIQTHYIHRVSNIEKILKDVGFTEITVYDSYTDNFYEDTSLRATFVCKKGD